MNRLSIYLGVILCDSPKALHWNICIIDIWSPISSEHRDSQTTGLMSGYREALRR